MALYQWLPEELDESVVVVTASRRLARELLSEYGERKHRAGLRAWRTPGIRYVGDWLAEILDDGVGGSPGLRIGETISARIWERALSETLGDTLPGSQAIAVQCRKTWSRLREWRVPPGDVKDAAFGAEQRMFAAAAGYFLKFMNDRRWLDESAVMDAACDVLAARAANTPSTVILAGFDRISPVVRRLIDALQEAATEVVIPERSRAASGCSISAYQNGDAELRAAGAWARAMRQDDASCRIAIIHPELERDAARVGRLVREGFVPGWQHGSARHRNSVNVSYGRALSEYPAIAVALLVLRWVAGRLSSREVGVLLRSPNLIDSALGGRGRVEMELRRLPEREWDIAQLLGAMRGPIAWTASDAWAGAWKSVLDKRPALRASLGVSRWAEVFDDILTTVGWPGSEVLSSGEFQLVNRWRELLNDFAQIEILEQPLGLHDAVSMITRLAGETLYQPESTHGSLPVLGALEAAGLEFDALWICGFDASRWPAASRPLAFVSRQLQRAYEMPDATVDDTLAFGRRVLERLLSSSPDVRFSWALTDEGAEQQRSPLAAGIDFVDVIGTDPGKGAALLRDKVEVTLPAEDPVPRVERVEDVSGGAFTVQRQTVDGFSAFARGRLHISDFQSFQAGLSAGTRGSLLHSALHALYGGRPTRQDIAGWAETERRERIGIAAEAATEGLLNYSDPALRRLIALEQERISRILQSYLEFEAAREDFATLAVEKELEYQQHNVRLRLRVDRVDRSDAGDLLVIDYKTGREKTLLNRSGDINDLQLVVYALALGEPVRQLAIVNLDSRGIRCSSTEALENWAASFAAWAQDVDDAIRGIAAGDARVNIAVSTDEGRPLNVVSRFEELRRE